jgi:HEAT repeat protein
MTIAELTKRAFYGAFKMNAKWLYILVLLSMLGCEPPEMARDESTLPVDEAIAEASLSKQLKINRDALLKGSSEQIRIDAATVMLFSEDPLAREILLDALKQSENIGARVAVCKSLNQARSEQQSIKNKEEFIPPLFDILATEVDDSAKFAAEAILIFEYDQIAKPLEGMVTDPSLPAKARLNAIYALRLQPDMRAIFKLIDRLDDFDEEVAAEAESALRSLGTPIGKDAEAREQIRTELKRKGRDEFFRDLLIRQEAKMRDMQAEKEQWQERYLSASGNIYDGISGDVARGAFLAEHLRSPEPAVKLWALEKVSQWRVGTKSRLPAELGPILVNLISDPDRDVRLKTAKLLSLMGELNSAERLLEQIQVEQNDQIKAEMFLSLGWACYYASLPNSEIKIPDQIRKKTLELATEYLLQDEPGKARKGAEVIKKLLEQDGLTSGEVGKYLGLLAERYKREQDRADDTVRGELLTAMAGLCAQSAYKAEAAKLFRPLFEQARDDTSDLVREAAVDGLIYIDKARALSILRRDFISDSSIIIRRKLIDLAGEVGNQEDLDWLAEKIGLPSEGEPAWQAMLAIFKGSDAAVLDEWIEKFDSHNAKTRLSDEQSLSVLEIAERKAVAENRSTMLRNVRARLASLYNKRGDFERAAEYLGMLRQVAQTAEEKEAISAELLGVYLRNSNAEAAVRLVEYCLLEKDLDSNNVIVLSVDSYLAEPAATTDANIMLEALTGVKTSEARPMWAEQVQRWNKHLDRVKNADKPGESGN